jgi:N-acetylneuraminate synthase
VSTVAVSLGASVIERHVTLNRADGGLDAEFSLEPKELGDLVNQLQQAKSALGSPNNWVTPSEKLSRSLRPSLFIVKDVKQGELISSANIASLRPAIGISPKYFASCIGKKFSGDFKRGTPLTFNCFS